MQNKQSSENIQDSFVDADRQPNFWIRLLIKLDFFSFLPVPKDKPVSTKRSLIGSVLFIILFLLYILFDIYQFLTQNPPIVENYFSTLDQQQYQLPKVAITFMSGQTLNTTGLYENLLSFKLTKQVKDNSFKDDQEVPLKINDFDNLTWLSNETKNFYRILRSPSQKMYAKGLLYSTNNCSYSKITISMCNVNVKDVYYKCRNFTNISSEMAKGRVFLFIQDSFDNTGVGSDEIEDRRNKFRIANFFLIPRMYKRVIVQYQVVKTKVQPDYFYRWKTQNFTRLQISSIMEQTSNTSVNDFQNKRQSLQLLGITFQLTAQTLEVKVTYSTLLDRISKWGAFFNVLFSIFAIFFLAYNRQKFYQKNPQWENFKKRDGGSSNASRQNYNKMGH